MTRPIHLALALACALAQPVQAEGPAPFRDFTFKRVKAPAPGERRTLVQIDPVEQARLLAPVRRARATPSVTPEDATPLPPVAKSATGGYGWFWDRVPVNGMGNGGIEPVLAVLSDPPSGAAAPAYRLEGLKGIADRHGAQILKSTIGTRVSPALALAVIAVESAGRAQATSHAGAQGLMQLIPATAERFGVADSYDPAQNITGGVRYLHWLMERFDGDPIRVLAGYNAGEGAVDKYDGVPPFAETMDYVPKVLAAFHTARGLCATPPVLVSDGCVFVGGRMAQAQ